MIRNTLTFWTRNEFSFCSDRQAALSRFDLVMPLDSPLPVSGPRAGFTKKSAGPWPVVIRVFIPIVRFHGCMKKWITRDFCPSWSIQTAVSWKRDGLTIAEIKVDIGLCCFVVLFDRARIMHIVDYWLTKFVIEVCGGQMRRDPAAYVLGG